MNLPVILTLVAAGLLTVMPLPEWLGWLRPEWVLMVLLYWVQALPDRYGVWFAFLTGIFMDVLTGAVLGQFALSYSVLAWSMLVLHKQMRVYPAIKQAVVVALLVGAHLAMTLVIRDGAGRFAPHSPGYWAPILTSALIWPWLVELLRSLGRQVQRS